MVRLLFYCFYWFSAFCTAFAEKAPLGPAVDKVEGFLAKFSTDSVICERATIAPPLRWQTPDDGYVIEAAKRARLRIN